MFALCRSSIKRYFCMGQGDFFVQFLDITEGVWLWNERGEGIRVRGSGMGEGGVESIFHFINMIITHF